ncbi:MAG: hypothetical protein KGI24_10055 [Candidatus Omnitrophica bacterium]|nr:hypothetical protein [Candidatus Omnitrophota bacterium]
MAKIFAINDINAFAKTRVLRRGIRGRLDKSACLVLRSADGLEDLADAQTIEAIAAPVSEDERAAFIRDYTGFIASLNSLHGEKFLWWATDISSKNRYVSPLPELVQELMDIERGLRLSQDRPLLIIDPSIGIYEALQKALLKYGRNLIWPQAAGEALLRRTAGLGRCFLRLLSHALRFYFRALWARIVLRSYARRRLSPQKEFYVIKTFSYPSSWDDKGDYSDPFFGRLPRILSKDNDVLVLSYHWQGYLQFIKRALREQALVLMPVEFFLNGWDVLRAFWRILTFRLEVGTPTHFRGMDVSGILRFELARTMNGIQLFQLLHYDAMRGLFSKLRVKRFLFTFENNPWERMSILACRRFSPLTRVDGYQHSVVPQAALNMFVHPSEKNIVPLPDRVLTAGEISKEIIRHYGDYGQVPVLSACALRYEYLREIQPAGRRKFQGHILLVLDGVEQTARMFKFAVEQLGAQSRYRLRVRCHPALPWELLSKKFHFDAVQYPHLEISHGDLKQDLAWSDIVIYWQSAVVLEALSMGKPVINFEPRDILSYDPLFQSHALKWTVTENGRLADVMGDIEQMDDILYQRRLAQALDYIRRYFHPVTDENLRVFKFD